MIRRLGIEEKYLTMTDDKGGKMTAKEKAFKWIRDAVAFTFDEAWIRALTEAVRVCDKVQDATTDTTKFGNGWRCGIEQVIIEIERLRDE